MAFDMFPINRYPRQPFSLTQNKREAPDAVRYSDNHNPFRETKRRGTWGPATSQNDNNVVVAVVGDPLARVARVHTSPANYHVSEKLPPAMTSALNDNGVHKGPVFEEAVAERRPETPEQKARQRFVRKFFKKTHKEHTDVDETGFIRERPWYKGKFLYHRPFTARNQLQATILNSWFNLLLICVPVGFALNYTKANPIAVFFVNFFAILPLAGLIGTAMDDLRLRTGDVLGALVYMSFGYDF